MASFLSQDWITEFAEAAALLPERPGLDGVVRFAISKTPHGKVQFRLVVADGRVVEVIPGRDGDQDATVTWAYPEAVSRFRGELDPDEAFMSGRCKVEGDYALYVFGLRPVFGSPEWAGLLADLAGRSAFDEV